MTQHFDLGRELREQSIDDWVFGSTSPKCIAAIPVEERITCLPTGEVQVGKEDMMDCASRGPINILETKFNWLLKNNKILPENKNWLIENGYITDRGVEFSDAFIAINSNTTRDGNSLKSPLETLRSKDDVNAIQGLIPKAMLPLETEMTFDEYHNPNRIKWQMIKLGQEFAQRFTIKYYRVYDKSFPAVLQEDMLDVAGFAWPEPTQGEYPRVEYNANHAFMLFGLPMSLMFDNYYDVVDNDFIKKLSEDYKFFNYGYKVIIQSQQVPGKAEKSLLLQNFINAIINFFKFRPKIL